jgi:hypothetical protein
VADVVAVVLEAARDPLPVDLLGVPVEMSVQRDPLVRLTDWYFEL